MGTSSRLQWWHTTLAGWWACRGGYSDGTQCWQDDGHVVEVTMMTHNAGWMMGTAWRLQWWHTMLAGWWAWRGGYNDGTMLAGWWARRGGYNDDTQCWLDDGHGVEVTMMAHNTGWMMGKAWRLQWWHTMLAGWLARCGGYNDGTMLVGWWARRGGYNDGTQCWQDDGHVVEVTMMAHNAGRMMGMPWRLQWWHTMLAGWWARRGGYNDDTQCRLDDGHVAWRLHGVEVTMMAHNAGWMMGMAWRLQWWHNAGRMMGMAWRLQWWHNAGRMMGKAWRLQWWHTMLTHHLQARCKPHYKNTWPTIYKPSVNHTTKIIDPPSTSQV